MHCLLTICLCGIIGVQNRSTQPDAYSVGKNTVPPQAPQAAGAFGLFGVIPTVYDNRMISSCGRDTVRTFVTLLLTGLILACPFVCGVAEEGHATHREHAAAGPANSPAPAHCPENNDDCICRGAVQSADVRVPGMDSVSFPLPLRGIAGILDHAPSHSLARLTSDGTPTGLASWGDAATIRAFLQNFRC